MKYDAYVIERKRLRMMERASQAQNTMHWMKFANQAEKRYRFLIVETIMCSKQYLIYEWIYLCWKMLCYINWDVNMDENSKKKKKILSK